MTPRATPTPGPGERTAAELEFELHQCVEGLQVQVRALGAALDHLCHALEALPATAANEAVATSIEDARLALGEIW